MTPWGRPDRAPADAPSPAKPPVPQPPRMTYDREGDVAAPRCPETPSFATTMQTLRGIAVSPGIAIGPAMVIDPRRLSFTATLKILRCRLPECPKSERGLHRWYHDLVAEVAEEVLEKRRNRINPRVIKRKMSNWKKKRPAHRNYPQPTKEFGAAIAMRR